MMGLMDPVLEAPEISVVVPCYQATAYLPVLLDSLYDQVDAPPTEIVLVDNRSTDDIAHLVEQYRDEHEAVHVTALRLVPAMRHQGVSYACNVGAARARASRLVFIGADDAASCRWLADARALFELSEVFCGSAIPVDGTQFDRPLGQIRALIEDLDAPRTLERSQRCSAFPVLMGGDLGITRELFLRVGGLDQSLPIAGEDNELALRLRQHGIEIAISPAFRIAYRQRIDPTAIARESRRAARAHVLNAARYGTVGRSPLVGGLGLPRLAARVARRGLRWPANCSAQQRHELMNEAQLLRGAVEGFWEHVVLGRVPAPRLGVGFEEAGD